MAGVPGIVLQLVDEQSGAVIDDQILKDIASFSPAPRHLKIRASLSVGPDNTVNVGAYMKAFQALKDGGFDPPWMVIHGGLETAYQKLKGFAYQVAMPNAKLGYLSNPLLNQYISALADKVVKAMTDFGDLCPKYWFLWNEANEDSNTLQEGQVPQKSMALSAKNYGALLATLSAQIKDTFPNVVLMPGSLSCLAKFNTDPAGPWVGQYFGSALQYMNDNGVKAPYNFENITLNLEGILTDEYVEGCAKQLSVVMRTYGLTGQTIIGEWGEENQDLAGVDMTETFQSLMKHFSFVFLYCYNTVNAQLYGVRTVGISPNGILYPRDKTVFYDQFANLMKQFNSSQGVGS